MVTEKQMKENLVEWGQPEAARLRGERLRNAHQQQLAEFPNTGRSGAIRISPRRGGPAPALTSEQPGENGPNKDDDEETEGEGSTSEEVRTPTGTWADIEGTPEKPKGFLDREKLEVTVKGGNKRRGAER